MIKRLLQQLAIWALVPIVLFEEWGWDTLARIMARLARLPLWAWLEARITRLPPWGALALFVLPAVVLLPVKMGALWLFAKGHYELGLAVLLSAKLLGTAILARLFTLTQPTLMKLRWFAKWYPIWKAWKDRLIETVRQSAPWKTGHAAALRVRQWWRSFRSDV
jgi:energy-coupling factor transporter transmembrane protein EcfT